MGVACVFLFFHCYSVQIKSSNRGQQNVSKENLLVYVVTALQVNTPVSAAHTSHPQ